MSGLTSYYRRIFRVSLFYMKADTLGRNNIVDLPINKITKLLIYIKKFSSMANSSASGTNAPMSSQSGI